MARNYTVSFNIRGSLDGSLLAAIENAQKAMKGLRNSAQAISNAAKLTGLAGKSQSLNAIQSAAAKFRELKLATVETQKALANAQTTAQLFGREYSAENAKRVQEINKQKIALARLKAEQDAAKKSLAEHRAGWKHFRDERAEIKARLKELGATKSRKIPRELLGTAKGREIGELGLRLNANKAALEAQRQKFKQARDEAQKYAKQIRETQNALKTQERLAAQRGEEFNGARAQVQSLKATLQTQLEALQRLRSQLGAAGFNTASFVSSERALQAEIERVNQSLQRQQQLLQAQGQFGTSLSNLSNAWSEYQNSLSTAQTLMNPFTSAAGNAMTFEHAMSRVKALTQSQNIREGRTAQVESEMAELEALARKLGATTQFTMTEAAQAMGYLGMAGWKKPQILKTMPGMLSLAAAAGADLAQTSDIVSDNMTAMGVPVEQAGHFMDVYAYALTNSNARLTDFGETMKYAAPVAKAYGATLDETAAMVMMMANAGIKGSMAGTSLRMGLLRLAGPPKAATKEMEKLGLSLSDAQAGALEAQAVLEGLDMGDILKENIPVGEKMTRVLMQLHEKTKDLSQDEKLAVFKGIFGVNAETGWLALFEQGPEVFLKYLQGLRQADGYAKQVASTMMDDTQGAMLILESSWDAVTNSIGTALLGAVRAAAEALSPMLTSLSQFIDRNPAIVQAAAGIAAALSGIIVTAAAVRLAFAGWKFITSTIELVSTALTGLGESAILGGLIGRLAAVRAALFGLNGAATLGGWSAMFSAIALRATAARTAIVGFFASLSVSSMVSGAIGALRSLGSAILGAARAAMLFALSPVGVALMALALAGLYCYRNWEKVAPVLSTIVRIITGALSGALVTILSTLNRLQSSGGFTALSEAASSLANVVGGTLVKAFAVLLTVAASVVAGLIQLFADLITVVLDFGTGLSEAFAKIKQGEFTGALEALSAAGKNVSADLSRLGSHVFDGFEQGAKNVQKVLDTLNMPKLPTQEVVARHRVEFDSSGQAQSPAPVIDTSATQAEVDALGTSAQNTATDMGVVPETLSQIPASLEPTTEALAQIPTAIQPTTEAIAQVPEALTTAAGTLSNALTQLGTEALKAATQLQTDTVALQMFGAATMTDMVALQMMGAAALTTGVALQMLGAAALGAVGGITALGSAASSAASSVSGLGAAAQSACSQLAAAGASAAAQVSSAASSAWSSFKSFIGVGGGGGGSFARGGLVEEPTFFAGEHGREMIIPLTEHHQRATSLWRAAGQMLGILPTTQGRKPDWSIKRLPRLPGQKGLPRINLPLSTPPTFPRLEEPTRAERSSPFNITINVTINGQADESTVRRGIESAMPTVRRTFAEELADWRREQSRRSFR